MNYKFTVVPIVLLASWLSVGSAAERYDLTVPLNISNLPTKVNEITVICWLIQADGNVIAESYTVVGVDTRTGRPVQDQAYLSIAWAPNSTFSGPPVRYSCSLHIPPPDIQRERYWPPSTHPDVEVQPAPGTILVEEVSGNLPAPPLPVE